MLNKEVINQLKRVIDDCMFEKNCLSENVKDEIASILESKEIDFILNALSVYVSDRSTQDKNVDVVVVIWALIIYTIDLENERNQIKIVLEKNNNLVNPFYGGLIVFLKGRSANFKVSNDLSSDLMDHKYRGVQQLKESYLREDYSKRVIFRELFKFCYEVMPNKFGSLMLQDDSYLIFLFYATELPRIEISSETSTEILKGEDSLRKNLLLFIQFEKIKPGKEVLQAERTLFVHYLKQLPVSEQVIYLKDYFSENTYCRELSIMEDVYTEDLYENFVELMERNLNFFIDILIIAKNEIVFYEELSVDIAETELGKKLVNRYIEFLQTGEYSWTSRDEEGAKLFASMLTQENKLYLKEKLEEYREGLMYLDIDYLLRPKHFYRDSKKSEYITGVLTFLEK